MFLDTTLRRTACRPSHAGFLLGLLLDLEILKPFFFEKSVPFHRTTWHYVPEDGTISEPQIQQNTRIISL
jgi:hypothetical protein